MKIAEYKTPSCSFFIPVNDFCKDAMLVNQQEQEDMDEDIKAAAWFEAEAEKQRAHDEHNFPSSFNNIFS